ncbi:MAG: hypothetical protein JW717_13390 [Marinilabiliaceae bacterium]|nr:hypothetical protein [Marinilabiliaceae bacterium]
MKKIIFRTIKYLHIALIFFISIALNAQISIKEESEIQTILTPQTKKNISKSDKLYMKGIEYDKKIESYEKEIEALRNSKGKIKEGKIKRLETKRNEAIIQSKPIFEDAFKVRFKAYDKQINTLLKETPNNNSVTSLNNDANTKYKQARKLFSKSENTAKTLTKVEHIVQGRQKFLESISLKVKTINTLITESNTEPKPSQSTITTVSNITDTSVVKTTNKPIINQSNTPITTTQVSPVASVITTPTPVALTKETTKPAVIIKEKELGNIFLSVQILATNSPATQEQIRNVYKGNMKVMEFKSGQYYRYNVGKFSTIDDAKKFIAMNNLKGFVVAYKDSQRISVNEAVSILSK